MKIVERFAWNRRASFQRMPATTATMKEEDTQTAAMLSLAVQSRLDVRYIVAPLQSEGLSPSLNR
jgi:hypothetical protein